MFRKRHGDEAVMFVVPLKLTVEFSSSSLKSYKDYAAVRYLSSRVEGERADI